MADRRLELQDNLIHAQNEAVASTLDREEGQWESGRNGHPLNSHELSKGAGLVLALVLAQLEAGCNNHHSNCTHYVPPHHNLEVRHLAYHRRGWSFLNRPELAVVVHH